MHLTEGSCDLLMAYHHASQPLPLAPERYEMMSLGSETLAPYAMPGPGGQPLFRLPTGPRESVPFLSYAPGAYLARLVEQILKHGDQSVELDAIYETDMAEGLKAMALEGHGLAFLPSSSVSQELRARRLVPAAPAGRYELTMEVRIYRKRPEHARHAKATAEAVWNFLRQR
jgi:DNA-binding transcriptional LysR family regulator